MYRRLKRLKRERSAILWGRQRLWDQLSKTDKYKCSVFTRLGLVFSSDPTRVLYVWIPYTDRLFPRDSWIWFPRNPGPWKRSAGMSWTVRMGLSQAAEGTKFALRFHCVLIQWLQSFSTATRSVQDVLCGTSVIVMENTIPILNWDDFRSISNPLLVFSTAKEYAYTGEVNIRLHSQEITGLLWKSKDHFRIYNSQISGPILSWISILTAHSFKSTLTLTSYLHLGLANDLLTSGFRIRSCIYFQSL